ncbi:MAG: low molecular weight protein-tyrosine-phosphatase [Comamonas sp.]
MKKPFRILMVCMGNICRSPTAHGVMQSLLQREGLQGRVVVDSCGTHDFHIGEAPDTRAQQHAQQRGYDLSALRARQVEATDFENADLILPMDMQNMTRLRLQCPPAHQHKLHLLTEFGQKLHAKAVPDPYYGGDSGFDEVLDLIEDACEGLLKTLPSEIRQKD